MRIQHNILAMNAYRNYNTNTSALGKNLEKLSSGYKINRAGDDAAGLAISEKMRAQIQGLNAAQKNVKDGTSLVKTAEGAMQEIQDMLGRMKYLATQSSNGTYDDEVDRKNLQDEVDQLRSEINRIADSANFNGIKLLDGSMDTNGTAKGAEIATNATVVQHETESVTTEVKPTFQISLDGLRVTASATTVKLEVKVGSATYTATATGCTVGAIISGDKFKFTANATQAVAGSFTNNLSTSGVITYTGTGTKAFSQATGSTLTNILNSNFAVTVTVASGGALCSATDANSVYTGKAEVITTGKIQNPGQVAQATFKLTADMLADGATITIGTTAVTVDYEKNASETTAGTLGVKDLLKSDGTIDMDKIDKIADAFTKANSANTMFKVGHNGDGEITVTQTEAHHALVNTSGASGKASQAMFTDNDVKKYITAEGKPGRSGSLQLQIGDTSDSYNQLLVSIKDMHTGASGLNIDSVDITNPTDAAKAIQTIMNAINTVSSTRGNLGAVQNRLDHTANNLSVMVENITDAESTIRDTDVAEEMMAYTKNNILVQSAQAMLAQANAVPQGVLQLLQ